MSEENKQKILQLISSIEDENINTQELVNYLFSTNFFESPATSTYAGNYQGGLVDHILNVYDLLTQMNKYLCVEYETIEEEVKTTNEKGEEEVIIEKQEIPHYKYSNDELILVSLGFALWKINYYEPYVSNKKVYSDKGSKFDNLGKFEWVSSTSYKVKSDRESYGSKGLTSLIILSQFVDLTNYQEVALAIVNQYEEGEEISSELKSTLSKHPLILLLHQATSQAYYLVDKKDE